MLFDRSWYNRSGVERVMGFASEDQVEQFFNDVPEFERMLVRSGIRLIKYWFSITDEEQQMRFLMRIHDPLKQWKLSPMDLQSRVRWEQYTKAKEETLARTNIPEAPWFVVEGNDKKRARLNCIDHFLAQVPYAPGAARGHHPARTRLQPGLRAQGPAAGALRAVEVLTTPGTRRRNLSRSGEWSHARSTRVDRAAPALGPAPGRAVQGRPGPTGGSSAPAPCGSRPGDRQPAEGTGAWPYRPGMSCGPRGARPFPRRIGAGAPLIGFSLWGEGDRLDPLAPDLEALYKDWALGAPQRRQGFLDRPAALQVSDRHPAPLRVRALRPRPRTDPDARPAGALRRFRLQPHRRHLRPGTGPILAATRWDLLAITAGGGMARVPCRGGCDYGRVWDLARDPRNAAGALVATEAGLFRFDPEAGDIVPLVPVERTGSVHRLRPVPWEGFTLIDAGFGTFTLSSTRGLRRIAGTGGAMRPPPLAVIPQARRVLTATTGAPRLAGFPEAERSRPLACPHRSDSTGSRLAMRAASTYSGCERS